jgi:hypothetical protein
MTEAQFTSKLIKSLSATGAYEVKITKTGSIPFSRLADHQNRALMIAKHGTLRYKIPDVGYQNPCDIVILHNTPAYIVCVFWQRGCDTAYLIDIDVWNNARSSSTRKSLTSVEAVGISELVIHLKR